MTAFRVGALIALVAMFLPADLSAQRIPLPGTRRGPARPAPLPPQAGPIARQLAYKRMNLSVESYPLITHIWSPGLTGGVMGDWTSYGAGTRADYRVAPYVSVTLDLTASFEGGPADLYTAELGTRLRPERSDRRLYPFADLRAGYIQTYRSGFNLTGGEFDYATPGGGSRSFSYGSGFGVVGGVGMEYALTRSFSLTTAGSVMRNRMTTSALLGGDPSERSFNMTLFRYTIGIRYNPVRVVQPPMTSTR